MIKFELICSTLTCFCHRLFHLSYKYWRQQGLFETSFAPLFHSVIKIKQHGVESTCWKTQFFSQLRHWCGKTLSTFQFHVHRPELGPCTLHLPPSAICWPERWQTVVKHLSLPLPPPPPPPRHVIVLPAALQHWRIYEVGATERDEFDFWPQSCTNSPFYRGAIKRPICSLFYSSCLRREAAAVPSGKLRINGVSSCSTSRVETLLLETHVIVHRFVLPLLLFVFKCCCVVCWSQNRNTSFFF